MKKEYNYWVDKRNTPHLDLYTKLIGISYGTLGVNFLVVFLYGKFVLKFEFSGMILILSIMMFMLTPVVMSDPKKGNRDFFAVVVAGVMHGVCTIGIVVLIHFWKLLIIYGIEILIVIFLIVWNFKSKHRNGFKKS